MIKEALEYIVGLGKATVVKVNETSYSDKPLWAVEPKIYRPEGLCLSTLSALVAYLKDNKDKLIYGDLIIHIKSYREVVLTCKLDERSGRNEYVLCTANNDHFGFGRFYDAEQFNIALQSMFCDAGDRAAILKIVGNVKAEGVQTTSDNGITQSVVTKQGIILGDNTELPNPVKLAPYRTFVEIAQPISSFVFRATGTDGIPNFALFEADGGTWKITAIDRIKTFFEDELEKNEIKGISILA